MNAQTTSTTRFQHLGPRVAEADSWFSRNYPGLLASLGLVAFLCVASTTWAQVAVAPNLGMAQQFGALGNSAVTGSAGAGTVVNGDVGSGPTSATINNFPPSSTVPPFIVHPVVDAVVSQAHNDANAAYVFLAGQGVGTPLGNNLSGLPALTPGVYSSGAADLAASTDLTLDDPTGTGIFVFNIASSLTMNGSSRVIGTANPCNVYWRVGSTAILNGTTFMGTVIADTSITTSGAGVVRGRLLAGAVTGTGVVTMATGGSTIGGCPPFTITPATLPSGTVGVPFTPTTLTPSGGTTPFTFTVVGGTLPPGLTLTPGGVLSGTPTTPGCVTVTIRATDLNGLITDITYTICSAIIASGGGIGVPTLSEWAMIMLAALLAFAGFAAMRRKAK